MTLDRVSGLLTTLLAVIPSNSSQEDFFFKEKKKKTERSRSSVGSCGFLFLVLASLCGVLCLGVQGGECVWVLFHFWFGLGFGVNPEIRKESESHLWWW